MMWIRDKAMKPSLSTDYCFFFDLQFIHNRIGSDKCGLCTGAWNRFNITMDDYVYGNL